MANLNWLPTGVRSGLNRMKKPITVATLLASSCVIGGVAQATWTTSPAIGPISSGRPELSASSTKEVLSGLLKSGLLQKRKERGSYVTLLEKPVLMQIKLVNGELAAVLTPATACPIESN